MIVKVINIISASLWWSWNSIWFRSRNFERIKFFFNLEATRYYFERSRDHNVWWFIITSTLKSLTHRNTRQCPRLNSTFSHHWFHGREMTDSQSEKKPLLGAVNEGDDGEEEVLEGCGGTMACNPHRPLHRYLVLAIMCFLSFGESSSINSLDPCFLFKFRNLEIFGNFNIIYYN